jgi:hypothetical protein
MDPVTVLWLIAGGGIILLLALFGGCLCYLYLAVYATPVQGPIEERPTGTPTTHGGTTTRSDSETGDTGDFVFGNID